MACPAEIKAKTYDVRGNEDMKIKTCVSQKVKIFWNKFTCRKTTYKTITLRVPEYKLLEGKGKKRHRTFSQT